ncbi:MAG: ATP-binding cassette domain-containing protein [Flammeovirgaceae bacterium]|nr:ATP-binding cassette domain-containing protein [Flammeovirgaceae bacterium]
MENQLVIEKRPVTNKHNKEIVTVQNIYKSFGDKKVLQGVSFHLDKGENLVVLGKSGTGKSVLIKCLVGLLYPDRGSVEVLGENVLELDPVGLDALRLKIGFNFQNSALYDSMTVGENLEFPLKRNFRDMTEKELDKAVNEALESVGLAHTRDLMPSELSGGMRKRIGIARTLILKPEIMLYDEPTSGLDPVTAKEINELIVEVKEKYHTAAIVITHDISCAKTTGDRIMALAEGEVLKEGTFEEVSKTNHPALKAFFEY